MFDWCEADLARLINYVEKILGFSQVVLIGHSLGATEAVYYKGKTSDRRVIALGLLGAPVWPRNSLDKKLLGIAMKGRHSRRRFTDVGNHWPIFVPTT